MYTARLLGYKGVVRIEYRQYLFHYRSGARVGFRLSITSCFITAFSCIAYTSHDVGVESGYEKCKQDLTLPWNGEWNNR